MRRCTAGSHSPWRCDRDRAFGQLLFSSAGLYHRHWRTFALVGLTAIPIIGGFNALTYLLTGDPGRQLDDEVGLSGLHVALGESSAGSAARSPRPWSPRS